VKQLIGLDIVTALALRRTGPADCPNLDSPPSRFRQATGVPYRRGAGDGEHTMTGLVFNILVYSCTAAAGFIVGIVIAATHFL
jgi:hypothetical protein